MKGRQRAVPLVFRMTFITGRQGVHDITFVLDAEDYFEVEGPRWLDHGSYFFGL